ncbi:hypothetical protein QLX67_01500 [Balneolaceae bacterium ANBcel3]|nr:hypothetical protein [Balneolaceae bacterium ANBcel3]
MRRIIIDIEIQNTIEIIRKQKGRFTAFMARLFVKEETLRKEVEDRILDEIQKTIAKNLEIRLHQEGIKANLKIRKENR